LVIISGFFTQLIKYFGYYFWFPSALKQDWNCLLYLMFSENIFRSLLPH